MSHHDNNSENYNNTDTNHGRQTPTSTSCCSAASAELKLYQTFIFSVPIFFTFVLLLLFYLVYLRRRRLDWSSIQMRTSRLVNNHISSACEMGLKKEVREMLPIILFKETFSVTDTQCSVCLGDYQAEDRLQQIPACGHAFHMDCIDHWLSTHTTCPLCRLSLLPLPKPSTELPLEEEHEHENADEEVNIHIQPSSRAEEDEHEFPSSSVKSCSHSCEDPPPPPPPLPPLTHAFPEGQRVSETGGTCAEHV